MQMVCQPHGITAVSYLSGPRDGKTMRYFALDGALPTGQILMLNTKLATLALIANGDDRPRLLTNQQFTASEMSLLLPLLELYPHYCPYEVIFASFYNGTITEEEVERCRHRLQEALESGTWDQLLRPMRNILSRVRLKLRGFDIDIVSILETGYLLMRKSKAEPVEPAKSA